MFSSEQWLANSGAGFYNGVATQSLRFDDGSSAYLHRTPDSASNQKTWTWSGWVKRGNLGATQEIFSADTSGTTFTDLRFADDIFVFISYADGYVINMQTDRLFRDTSAWYHLVVAIDTTQGTDTNRVKIYVNGVQETSFATETYPAINTDTYINREIPHDIGRKITTSYLDAYLSEVNFIDGLALAPSSFGETKNGVWIPIDTSGLTFGTNGFRLKFDQVGVGTASSTTIGADTSGNTNHWTSSGIVASDCAMPDSPENNFATFNPNFRAVTANTLSEGNLFCATSSGGRSFSATTIPIKLGTGKWFWEFRVSAAAGGMGVAKTNGVGGAGAYQSVTSTGTGANTTDYYYGETNFVVYDDQIFHNAGNAVALDGTETYPEVYGILFDSDASPPNMAVYRGGTAVGNIDCDNGFDYLPMAGDGSGAVTLNVIFNAGQDASFAGNETAGTNQDANGIGNFSMAVPTDAKALCTANLPEPTIGANSTTQADDHFNTVLYTGNGGTQAITGVGFQPDWVWIKERSSTSSHALFDSNRGVTNLLSSDLTSAETDSNSSLTAFGTDGFTSDDDGKTNQSSQTYVAWNWKANGGTTVSNTDGSITSTVQANTDAGFSIVTYTGNSTAGATVGHGLGVAPNMIIIKDRPTADNWAVYHSSLVAGNSSLFLEATTAVNTSLNMWNSTAPSSSVITLGDRDEVNRATSHIAYCFAEIDGYSKFGSYTGNGSADGTFVYTGFRPAYVMFKITNTTGDWNIYDSARSTFNIVALKLRGNVDGVEITSSDDFDILSNGFKLRDAGAGLNGNGNTYIYMAFAESPFKYANAR